jgi:RNA polymerase sigma-54 factor
MRPSLQQNLKLAQQMRLTPRMIQAMEILQLPTMDLQHRIDEALQSNPVLEVGEDQGDGDEAPSPADAASEEVAPREQDMVVDEIGGNEVGFERLADFMDEYGSEIIDAEPPRRPRKDDGGEDAKLAAMANTPARVESLHQVLLEQWAFVDTPGPVTLAGKAIIDEIDDDGYLRMDLEQWAFNEETPYTPSDLAEALRGIQELDPSGVGARDLRECLLIQLTREAQAGRDVALERVLVERFLRDIEMNHIPAIARKVGRPVEDVQAAIENLSHLHPRPGRLVGGQGAPIIVPDVIVEICEDRPVVTMADDRMPPLQISSDYKLLSRDRNTDKQAKQFLRSNIQSAQWLIHAIAQRRETIGRVAQAVFEFQMPFLLQGPAALKPLPMAQVAARVGVHVATVSRAVAGKYAQTPQGIFPLRMFFSGGTTRSDGEDVSWDAIKVKLQEIVDAEDKSNPLSDDKLAAALEAAGLSVARRTVAKYRNAMDIPPARKRRQY